MLQFKGLCHATKGRLQSLKSCQVYYSTQNANHMKTFANQSKLPRLPVPPLKHTLELYEKSTMPLRINDDTNGIKESINNFISPQGLGNELQKRLEDYDKQQKTNWLEDIWLDKAYLSWRGPSFMNVNFWAEFVDHPDGLDPSPKPNATTSTQIERASGLIHQLLNFNDGLNREEITPDFIKDKPLCMNQYKHIFGTSRIPKPNCDELISSYPSKSTYIVLSYKNKLVQIPVYTASGSRVHVSVIENQLAKAVTVVDTLDQSEQQAPIGILTSEHRDTWTDARQHLESLSKRNRDNLKIIDEALFVVCFDTIDIGINANETHHYLMHRHDAMNRWFDKSFQLIVASNGRAGINGEHSPADAVTVGRVMVEAIQNETYTDGNYPSNVEPEPVKILCWDTDAKIVSTIEDAKENAKKLSKSFRSALGVYDEYGANSIKKSKLSPDALVQMALQLAYYRAHGKPCGTYETASTRAFLHGRTETVRSCSWESYLFSKVIENPGANRSQKLEALNLALKSHTDYMKRASAGLGVDRHFLGLRCMLKPGEAMPDLFTNPYFAKSGTFTLSTSNMSPGTYLYGGFAPVVLDGYGFNYAIANDNIRFSVSDWATSPDTDYQNFKKQFFKALDDIGEVVGL